MIKNSKFARFYLLTKINGRVYNVPGRPIISKSGCSSENISYFLNYHMQLLVQAAYLYIRILMIS